MFSSLVEGRPSICTIYMLQNTTVSREQNGELWKDIICVYFEVHLWHFRGHFRGLTSEEGHMAAQVFEALRYKPQGRGYDY